VVRRLVAVGVVADQAGDVLHVGVDVLVDLGVEHLVDLVLQAGVAAQRFTRPALSCGIYQEYCHALPSV
jgi:hypothetical protein